VFQWRCYRQFFLVLLLYFCAVIVNISSDLNTSLTVLFCFGTILICPAVLHKTHNYKSKALHFLNNLMTKHSSSRDLESKIFRSRNYFNDWETWIRKQKFYLIVKIIIHFHSIPIDCCCCKPQMNNSSLLRLTLHPHFLSSLKYT
jgi:hypothetical protein